MVHMLHAALIFLLSAAGSMGLPMPPMIPQGASPAYFPPLPSKAGAAQLSSAFASNPVTRLQSRLPTAFGWRRAEVALASVLTSTSPAEAAKFYESEVLGLSKTADGEPSVAALLDLLELAKPPAAKLGIAAMTGEWQLAYTSAIPAVVREEISLHGENEVLDLSVVRTVDDNGEMNAKATIYLQGGRKKVVDLLGSVAQTGSFPNDYVRSQDWESMSAQVTFLGEDLLVLRNSIGLSQDSPPNTEVWRKISASPLEPQSTAAARASLWRFGLPCTEPRLGAGRSGLAAKAPWGVTVAGASIELDAILLTAATAALAAGLWWWRRLGRTAPPSQPLAERRAVADNDVPHIPDADEAQVAAAAPRRTVLAAAGASAFSLFGFANGAVAKKAYFGGLTLDNDTGLDGYNFSGLSGGLGAKMDKTFDKVKPVCKDQEMVVQGGSRTMADQTAVRAVCTRADLLTEKNKTDKEKAKEAK